MEGEDEYHEEILIRQSWPLQDPDHQFTAVC